MCVNVCMDGLHKKNLKTKNNFFKIGQVKVIICEIINGMMNNCN